MAWRPGVCWACPALGIPDAPLAALPDARLLVRRRCVYVLSNLSFDGPWSSNVHVVWHFGHFLNLVPSVSFVFWQAAQLSVQSAGST